MQSLTPAPFQTMAEVDQYLGGDTVECLLCGKTYQVLELHLTRTHEVLADDYRRRFGIPFSRSLTSAVKRQKCREQMTPQFVAAGLANLAEDRPDGSQSWLKGRVAPVSNQWRKIIAKSPSHREPRAIPCSACGAEVPTAQSEKSDRVLCVNCVRPAIANARRFVLRHKSETRPAALSRAELAEFKTPFQTMEEVNNYLSGEVIPCLLCGKHYRNLAQHIRKTHVMEPDDYRREFGIPYTRALFSEPALALSKAAMTGDRLARFKVLRARLKSEGRLERYRRPRPVAPCVRNLWESIFEKGREFSRKIVTVSCVTCGAPIVTTAFNATQPIHCVGCAKDKRRNRPRPWRDKKAA